MITATYNCASSIHDCLNSVAGQSWPHIEHIVIDGASSDGTLAILHAQQDGISKLISEPDEGIYDALNKGLAHASGDVIGFLHADDVYSNNQVISRLAAAFSDESVQATYSDLDYVRKDDLSQVVRHWRSGSFFDGLLERGWMPPHPTLYVRREWYERMGGFDQKYKIAADYFSILQFFADPEFQSFYIPEVLVKMRLGGSSNRSIRNIVRKSREDMDILRRTGIGGLKTLWLKNFSKLQQFIV